MFVRIRMLEQVGSGIGRIKDQMNSAKLPEPQFKTDGMFTVVHYRTVEETVGIILKAMRENPKITAKGLEEITGLTRRGVEYHIDKLKKGKRIKKAGSTKGEHWELTIQNS
ncbi:MAG: ATP-binding protein [Cyclobacteriaceae bacterium]